MDLRPVERAAVPEWYDRELTKTFPPNEQKPLAHILALIDEKRYTLLGLYDGADLLGYASLWRNPDHAGYVLLDYLGVTASRRSGGLGGHILSLLRQRCAETIIIEAESPASGGSEEDLLRARRIAFYERAGCQRLYEIGICGVRCQAMSLGPVKNLAALTAAHRAIYGPLRTDMKIPLGPEETPPPALWNAE